MSRDSSPRRLHKTAGVVSADFWEFQPGQPVNTVDGLPGVVAEVQDGPYPGDEQYIVTLDNGMGGGEYTASQLSPMGTPVLARWEDTPESDLLFERASDYVTAGNQAMTWVPDDEDSLGAVASSDYPELAEILVDRPPLAHSEPLQMRASNAEDKKMSSREEKGADQHVLVATAALWDRVLSPVADALNSQMAPQYKYHPGQGADWCRFRANEHCLYAKHLDVEGTKEAGYAVWTPEDRGPCPRTTVTTQRACPVGEPGPHSGESNSKVDATVSWQDGGQRGGQPSPHPELLLQNHSALTEHLKVTAGFEVTASWADVRAKAKRIRSEGGVRIISAPDASKNVLTVTAEVNGDTHVYETTLLREPGRQNVASWRCGCAWGSYSWGRSAPFKRFEGRMCSHALATQYEAQGQGMFGRQIVERTETPPWRVGNDPFEYVKPPRGEHARAASLTSRFRPVYVDPELAAPPLHTIATMQALQGALTVTASNAKILDFGGRLKALVHGTVKMVKYVFSDVHSALLDDGSSASVNDLLYPTYDPHLGLDWTPSYGSVKDAAVFEGDLHEEPEAALPTTDGSDEALDKADLDKTAMAIGITPTATPEQAMDELLMWAHQHDALITNAVRDCADATDGEMDAAFLPNRVKGRKRGIEKIEQDVEQKHLTPAQVAMRFPDGLRYTVLYSTQDYARKTNAFLDQMAVRGFRPDSPDRVKNFWLRDDPYDGINSVLRGPDGFPFEVQFHTSQSMGLKDEIHIEYAEFRGSQPPPGHSWKVPPTPERRMELWKSMVSKGATIERPTQESQVGEHTQHFFSSTGEKFFYYAFAGDVLGEINGIFRRVESPTDVRFERYSVSQAKWVEDNSLAGHLVKGAVDVDPVDEMTATIYINTTKKTSSFEEPDWFEQGSFDEVMARFAAMGATVTEVTAVGPLEHLQDEAIAIEAFADPALAPEMAEVVTASLVDTPPTPGDSRLAWLMSDGAAQDSGGDFDPAVGAKAFLAKEALKSFSPEEQKAIIEEGIDVQAANLGDLDLAGTHYAGLEEALAAHENDDDGWLS